VNGKTRNSQKDKRQRILKEAAREFVTKGYGGANVNVIAEKSGIGKGTLYLYFQSKAELFAEALKESNKLWMQKAGEMAQGKGDPLQSLRELLKVDVLLGVEHQELAQLWISSFFGDNRQFAGTAAEVLEEYAGLVESLVKDCIKRGLFRKVDPRLATYMLLGLNEITIAFYGPLLREMGEVEPVCDSLQKMVFDGLLKKG
jgi:AcrR family transcriptional regulator